MFAFNLRFPGQYHDAETGKHYNYFRDYVVKVSTVRKLPPPVAFDADDGRLLAQVVSYYHETLKNSPEALAYLEARGLVSAELVDRFKLGFANRTLGLRPPMANRVAGAEVRARLQKLGVLRSSGHEHFNAPDSASGVPRRPRCIRSRGLKACCSSQSGISGRRVARGSVRVYTLTIQLVTESPDGDPEGFEVGQ